MSITLAAIIKNEVHNLPRLLDSIKDVVSEVVIVDTGSTDGSVELVRARGGLVIDQPWKDDFAFARNTALESSSGEFILHMDGDEYLMPEDAAKFLGLSFAGIDVFSTAVYEQKGKFLGFQPRLTRNRPDLRYTGRVHESLTIDKRKHTTQKTGIKIIHTGYSDEEIGRKGKEERNRLLVERALAEEPNNYYVNFLAAREYDRIKDDRALPLYDKALRLGESKLGPDLYKLYSTALARNGQFDRALRVIAKGISSHKLYPDLYFVKGLVHLDKNENEEAINAFKTCLEMVERSRNVTGIDLVALFRAMGIAFFASGQKEMALNAFNQALAFDPADEISK